MTAQEAFDLATRRGTALPIGRSVAFICPFPNCGVLAQHAWGHVTMLSVLVSSQGITGRQYQGKTLISAYCEACNEEVLYLDGSMIWPRASEAPAAAADLPEDLVKDYNEARSIYQFSPRGAAALLRLLIQKLCIELGSKDSDINAAIGSFVADGKISGRIQQALDAVRVIGNEAVHPGSMDLRDDAQTVNSLFGLINFIVEKMITEPREIDQIYNSLPAGKLAAIGIRDAKGNKTPKT